MLMNATKRKEEQLFPMNKMPIDFSPRTKVPLVSFNPCKIANSSQKNVTASPMPKGFPALWRLH